MSVLFAVLTAFWFGQAKTSQKPLPPYTDADAYAVYAALLPNLFAWQIAHAEELVIQSETETHGSTAAGCIEAANRDFFKSHGDLIKDFDQANKGSRRLIRDLTISKQYVLLPKKQFTGYFANKNAKLGWDAFSKAFPKSGGYQTVSAVGFNAQKTEALVYAQYGCGRVCGNGAFHYFKKQNGTWQEIMKDQPAPGTPLFESACGWDS